MSAAPSATNPLSAAAAVLAAEEERLLACVHCGFCLQACPTYTRLGDEADSPRGRLALMRAVAEGRLDPAADAFQLHIDRCLGCRGCESACPSGVEYGHLLERAREAAVQARGLSWPTRALLIVFGNRTLSGLAHAGGRLLRGSGVLPLLLRLVPRRFGRARFGLAMLGATRPWRGLGRVGSEQRAVGNARPNAAPAVKVAVLDGCVQEGLFTRVNAATRRVLEANGCEIVAAPEQRCCGALHAHAGAREGAEANARANIAAFEGAGVDYVIVNAAGCGAAMKEYGALLAGDPLWADRARAFSARVRDLFEFLAERGVRPGAPLPLRVTYDAPCHLHHAQRITQAPLEVLATIPALELLPLPGAEECCGGAGIYGVLHPDLGGKILQDKVEAIRGTGAEVIVTPNPGCTMQIGAGLLLAGADIPVLHPVELLAESYRRLGL